MITTFAELKKQNEEKNRDEEKRQKEMKETIEKEVRRTGIFKFSNGAMSSGLDENDQIKLLETLLGEEQIYIHTVSFSGMPIPLFFLEKTLTSLFDKIKDNKTLVRLEISEFSFRTEACLRHFLTVLESTNITELHFVNWNTELRSEDSKTLESMTLFSKSPCIQKLSSFVIGRKGTVPGFSGCVYQAKGEALVSLLQKANFKTLNLSGYVFSDKKQLKSALEAIANMMALKNLDLSNMRMGKEAFENLTKVLVKRDLEELDLSNNTSAEDPFLQVELLKSLLDKRTLTRLGFAENNIGTEGFQFLCPYFKGEAPITRIHLQANGIDLKKVQEEIEALASNMAVTELGILNIAPQYENRSVVRNEKKEEKESQETGMVLRLLGNSASTLQVFPLGVHDMYNACRRFYTLRVEEVRSVAHTIINSNFSLTNVNHGCIQGFISRGGEGEELDVFGKMINYAMERNQRIRYNFFKLTSACLGSHLMKPVMGIVLDYLDVDLNYASVFIEYAYMPCTEGQTNEQRLISRLKKMHAGDLKKVEEETRQSRESDLSKFSFRTESLRRPVLLDDEEIIQPPRRLNINLE